MRMLLIIGLAIILIAGCAAQLSQVCFKDSCVTVTLATTPEQHARGLMWRDNLGADEGMLFVFPTDATRAFWMKNTLIPLDMIWLDAAGSVVHIVTAQPCTTEPCPSSGPEAPSRYVLETNEGWAERHAVEIGSIATLPAP